MFETASDVKAAERAILDVFKKEDKKTKEESVHIFLGAFLKQYHLTKGLLTTPKALYAAIKRTQEKWKTSKTTREEEIRDFMTGCQVQLKKAIERLDSLPIWKSTGQTTAYDDMINLGSALGGYIGVIESIPEEMESYKKQVSASSTKPLVELSDAVAARLKKQFGERVHTKFIQKRIDKIARKYKGKLTSDVQSLLAKMRRFA